MCIFSPFASTKKITQVVFHLAHGHSVGVQFYGFHHEQMPDSLVSLQKSYILSAVQKGKCGGIYDAKN